MNPIFIISDATGIIENDENKNYGFYNEESSDTILTQYHSFRSVIFSLNNYNDEIFNNEIILVYIRNLSNDFNKHGKLINELIKDKIFNNDVLSIFFIDILNNLSGSINIDILEKNKEFNTGIIANTNAELFYLILSKESKEGREVTINEIHYQIAKLVNLLNTSYIHIYNYFQPSTNKLFHQNTFGSSLISFPDKEIKDSIFYLNNASQLYYLLHNEKFNKDELYNISSKIPLLDDKSKVDKILINEYSKVPDEVNVINSVNKLYNDCDIDNITNTFDTIDLFPFSDFTSNNENLSTSKIDATHNDYLLDVNHRTTNAIKETEKFFETAIVLFKDYRNDKIISIQKKLNKQKKDKKKDIYKAITNYFNNLISTDYKNLNNEFGDTTSFEALIKSLSYFASGSKDDEFDHDKNLSEKIKKISKESTVERAVKRRKLFKKFYDTNNHLKESIENIDNELENINLKDDEIKDNKSGNKELKDNESENKEINDEIIEDIDGDTGFRKLIEQRKQLSFSLIDKDLRVFNKYRYSFIQLAIFFSILTSVILFFSSYYFIPANALKYTIFIGYIPIIIGSISIISKIIQFKKYKKYLESLITKKVSLLNDVISNHDNFVRSYVSQIKIEYTLEILKDIQNYCKLKVYKLVNLRKYLINHYIYSINMYNAVNFDSSVFEYSLITKKQFENLFFDYSFSSYFEKHPKKKLDFFKLYIDKSKTDIIYHFSSNTLNIDFFDENEIAYDKVNALNKHKSEATYHNNFDKEPILFISNDDNPEPIILEDINQGQIGNCYFMASIGAIAHTNPSYIRKMITLFDQSDDIAEEETESTEQSFLVRFFDADRNEKYIAIDNKFWFYNESLNPVYAKFGYKNEENYEIWPMILEKAWAKVNKGYEKIIGSNKQQRKLDFGLALSGNFIDSKSINDFNNNEAIISSITDNLKKDIPVVVYSSDTPKDNSVVNCHAYTVKSIDNNKINLYNPHGENHQFDKTIDFFKENFDTILFFNLEDTSELIIPPTEKVKYVDHIKEIEEDLRSFFGNELSAEIQNIPIFDFINDEEFKKVMKRIDKSSSPLFNYSKIENEYSILFTDIDSIDVKILKNNPNEIRPKISDDIYLLLTKFISWEIS